MSKDCLQSEPIEADTIPDVIEPIVDKRIGTYVTGSFIVGGATRKSDIDIVIPIDNAIPVVVLDQIANSFGGTVGHSEYNNGLKLKIPGATTINILQLHPLDYAAFMFATGAMARAPIVTDRTTRHRCFEELCHAYKSFINPRCVTIAEMHKVMERNLDVPYMAHKIDWRKFYAR